VGKVESNRANLRQRYELIPYYYSLAYRAHLLGEPLVPPLVFYYQDDPQVFRLGHEKLIGHDLLVGIVARYGEYERDIYLPKGRWVNYHSQEWVQSIGQTIKDVPAFRAGLFRLPAFARAGAILPQMHVDEKSKDAFGNRSVADQANEVLIARVFADDNASTFTLYEDDGKTLKYQTDGRPLYHHRTTDISQQQVSNAMVKVRIEKAADVNGSGAFEGAVSNRHNVVRLVVDGTEASAVALDGVSLPLVADEAAFEAADRGWFNHSRNVVWAKSPKLDVYATAKEFIFTLQAKPPASSVNFVCSNGQTNPGESIYVVGSIPALGSWDIANAIKLDPNIYYEYIVNPPVRHFGPGPNTPTWTGVVSELPPNSTFEWKFIRKREDGMGTPQFELGPNHAFTTVTSGYSGHAIGSGPR
jgi:alpha-glucosidase